MDSVVDGEGGKIWENDGIFNSLSPVIEIQSYCIMVRKDAWNDFNFFEFTKARLMA